MDELTVLSNATLGQLPASIKRPTYNRETITPGIVHIGVGNFHRAHQAWYLHQLMEGGQAFDWGIIGAGVRPYDDAMRGKLKAQDWLTTLVELSPGQIQAKVTGSMIGYAPVKEGHGPLIAQMSATEIRIVSLTITEGGYYQDATSGALDVDHPDILHDTAHPSAPRTAFGAIVEALRLRHDSGLAPFAVLSCDNLQGNGNIARQTVVGLATLSDPDLAAWIDHNASFPNSMVDCIVPATGENELALARGFGVDDNAPVTHEDFRQWVIEDDFCAGRPNWDVVGATFATDVHAYEMMKLRMLNAGHQVLANAGEILGVETIAGCMAHPGIAGLLAKVQAHEIIPQVKAVPDMEPSAYLELISSRFANSRIKDTTRRVAFDGSSRHPSFLLPIIRDALDAGTPIDGLALVEALWARMCAGIRENGTAIVPNDPIWDDLTVAADAAKSDPIMWLMLPLYGDLIDHVAFLSSFSRWLKLIWSDGVDEALGLYIADGEN